MKPGEKKLERSTSHKEIYHDGGTLTHYLGNDDYKEGNRESDEWSEDAEKEKEIGHIAFGNEDIPEIKEAST